MRQWLASLDLAWVGQDGGCRLHLCAQQVEPREVEPYVFGVLGCQDFPTKALKRVSVVASSGWRQHERFGDPMSALDPDDQLPVIGGDVGESYSCGCEEGSIEDAQSTGSSWFAPSNGGLREARSMRTSVFCHSRISRKLRA